MTVITDREATTIPDLQVRKCGHALGAHVMGFDLRDATPVSARVIGDLLVDHKVLIFRGQSLTPADHSRLAHLLGEPTPAHPVLPGFSPEFPEIWQIDSTEKGAKNDIWHTDVTFVERPPMGSILRAIDVPAFGGDTSWACLEAAYESLPPTLRAFAESLSAAHDGAGEFGEVLSSRGTGNEWEGRSYDELTEVVHPVVRVHPVTGRKSLFVNPGFTTRIIGLSASDSRHVLHLFFDHIARPEHTIRHSWEAGDVIMWDNRNTVHYANDDVTDFRRIMHRITLTGDLPTGPGAA